MHLFRHVFFASLLILAGVVYSQPAPVRDDAWRQQKLWTTSQMIKKGDFSPITEAFIERDIDLLWSYYRGSDYLLYHTFKRVTPEMMASATEDQKQRYALMQEREKLAASYLLQIPEHARHVGDWIEKSTTQKGVSDGRHLRISAMGQLGSDEVIVELGRFLFDDRNPDVTGPVHPLTLGVPKTIKHEVAGNLIGLLRRKPGMAAEIKAAAPSAPGWFERVQNWWLKSEEAAPYRRKLADAGVVLPPGYPPMKELKGAKSTIAPSSPSSPPSAVQQTGETPPAAASTTLAALEPSAGNTDWRVWLGLLGGLILVIALSCRGFRKRK